VLITCSRLLLDSGPVGTHFEQFYSSNLSEAIDDVIQDLADEDLLTYQHNLNS